MTYRAYNISVRTIGFLTCLALSILKILGLVYASWWVIILVPIVLSAVFVGLGERGAEEGERTEVVLQCNCEENARMITDILNADADGEVFAHFVTTLDEAIEAFGEDDEEDEDSGCWTITDPSDDYDPEDYEEDEDDTED